MGLQAYLTLAGSIVFTTSIIYYVHHTQNEVDAQMKSTYKVALEEREKKEQQREENRLFMIQQQKLTEILTKAQEEDEQV